MGLPTFLFVWRILPLLLRVHNAQCVWSELPISRGSLDGFLSSSEVVVFGY